MTAIPPKRNPSEQPARHIAGNKSEPSDAQAGVSERIQEAVMAARKLLVETVDAVDPDTTAEDLLVIVAKYRARLAELVAVLPAPDSDDDA
jgi:hypothetical protein